jgi:hypothetical protein
MLHQLRVVGHNILALGQMIARPDTLPFAACLLAAFLASAILALVAGLRRPVGFRQAWAIATVLTYVSGYLLVFCQDARYFWPLVPVMLALLFQWLDWLRGWRPDGSVREHSRFRQVSFGLLAVAVTLSSVPARHLVTVYRAPTTSEFTAVAAQIGQAGIEGPMGTNEFEAGLYLSYYLKVKDAGAPVSSVPEDVVREAQRAGVRTFVTVRYRPDRGSVQVQGSDLNGLPGVQLVGKWREAGNPSTMLFVVYHIAPSAGAERPSRSG